MSTFIGLELSGTVELAFPLLIPISKYIMIMLSYKYGFLEVITGLLSSLKCNSESSALFLERKITSLCNYNMVEVWMEKQY